MGKENKVKKNELINDQINKQENHTRTHRRRPYMNQWDWCATKWESDAAGVKTQTKHQLKIPVYIFVISSFKPFFLCWYD